MIAFTSNLRCIRRGRRVAVVGAVETAALRVDERPTSGNPTAHEAPRTVKVWDDPGAAAALFAGLAGNFVCFRRARASSPRRASCSSYSLARTDGDFAAIALSAIFHLLPS